MKTYIYIILLFVFSQNITYSQSYEPSLSNMKGWELIGYAKNAANNGDTYSAIKFYEEYYVLNSNNDKVALELANLYYDVHNYIDAKDIYKKLYDKDNEKYLLLMLKYCRILQSEKKYKKAIKYLNQFRRGVNKYARGYNKQKYTFIAKNLIKGCRFSAQKTNEDESVFIYHLNNTVNKPYLETSPLIYNDSVIYYSSMSYNNNNLIDEDCKSPKNKFYSAKLVNNNWIGGHVAEKPFFNSNTKHSANGFFSKDGKRFYFTYCSKNEFNKKISQIYVSKNIDGEWIKPEKLNSEINLQNYTSTQPTIGNCYLSNYELLYFISDRPGSIGGKDIWFTVYDKNNDTYKKPVNAGGYINTFADEATPFYDTNEGVLYYSSNGLPGYGGYDIYKSKGWGASWEPASNLKSPINSPYDDLYYTKNNGKQNGFIVSNRDGSIDLLYPNCCYDIFEFSQIKKKKITNKQDSLVEEKLEKQLETTIIKENTSAKIIKNKLEEYVKEKIKYSKPPYNNTKRKMDPVKINNIYFDYNSCELKKSSQKNIDTTILHILKKYKNITIEISAHTDYKGTKSYNQKLSTERAKSVTNYLISKGISARRIKAKGYGEKYPIEREIDEYGNDIPTGRRLNRRIEFKIVKISNN